jgi:hypothetical protein
MAKLRRSLDEAWRDTGMEKEIAQVRRDLDAAIPAISRSGHARAASAEMDKRIRANEEFAKQIEAPKESLLPPRAANRATTTLVDI